MYQVTCPGRHKMSRTITGTLQAFFPPVYDDGVDYGPRQPPPQWCSAPIADIQCRKIASVSEEFRTDADCMEEPRDQYQTASQLYGACVELMAQIERFMSDFDFNTERLPCPVDSQKLKFLHDVCGQVSCELEELL